MSVTLLIGHRGVGKTSLLRRIGAARPSHRHFFDLDQELEVGTGTRIDRLLKGGEPAFRRLEVETLGDLVRESKLRWETNAEASLIAVGAGIEAIPDGVQVVWVRRSTDPLGRVFENRPRLDPALSPYDEYMQRFPIRESRFQNWAQEQLWLPEGYETGLEGFFEPKPGWNLPYDLTLLPENFRDWPAFLNRRKKWAIRRFELRDDLLTPEQIALVKQEIPLEQLLLSVRREASEIDGVKLDWALELGAPSERAAIVSLHERGENLAAAFSRLDQAAYENQIQKLSVEIHSFEELMKGHQWWLEKPALRAFLPRSMDGRWRWYRSLFGPTMPIHFFREGEGSASDQPFLWQVLHQPKLEHQFAAVLGDPVEHSRSPIEHLQFFKDFGIPFVAIRVTESEWETALPILRSLGLGFAAVTAPLKKKAGGNTLVWREKQFEAANTDVLALREIASDFEGYNEVWCWGRGGVTPSVAEAWPAARLISAREGVEIGGKPDLFIWATGRTRPFVWPPKSVKTKQVLDLNYTEDSPGLEWAVTHKFPYQSGLRMFKLQAEFQRQIWRSVMEKQ